MPAHASPHDARLVAHLLTGSSLLALAGGALGVIAAVAFLERRESIR